MPPRTLQIALLGGSEEAVLVGLRNFPAHQLTMIAPIGFSNQAQELSKDLIERFKLTVEVKELKDSAVSTMLDTIGRVSREQSFQDFLMNVGSAGREQTSAAVTAAFVHGIRAFDVINDRPVVLPIMNFSYAKAVTEPKMQILRAVEKSGGDVESLEKLSELSNYGKPLLSYHIRGSEDGRGLEELGLVELERGRRGRIRVKLTVLGRTLLSASAAK